MFLIMAVALLEIVMQASRTNVIVNSTCGSRLHLLAWQLDAILRYGEIVLLAALFRHKRSSIVRGCDGKRKSENPTRDLGTPMELPSNHEVGAEPDLATNHIRL